MSKNYFRIIAALTLLTASPAFGQETADQVTTKLTPSDVTLFSDGKGHYVLIPHIAVSTSDGRKTSGMEDNIFIGAPSDMKNAFGAGYESNSDKSAGDEFSETSFTDGGNLKVIYSDPGKIRSASVTCGDTKIALSEDLTKAVDLGTGPHLQINSNTDLEQIYKFPDGRYLVETDPDRNGTTATKQFWLGPPGAMKNIAHYLTTSGSRTSFSASPGIPDQSRLDDFGISGTPTWIDGKSGTKTKLKRLSYHPDPLDEMPSDPTPPPVAKLQIPTLSAKKISNSICQYFGVPASNRTTGAPDTSQPGTH